MTRLSSPLYLTLIIASVIWTVGEIILSLAGRHSGEEIWGLIREVTVFFVLAIITEIMFIMGAILALKGLGQKPLIEIGRNPFKWWSVTKSHWRTWIKDGSRSPLFLLGFHLNWIGAVGTGIVWAAGIIALLPMRGWWQLIGPLADIIMSLIWRVALSRKLKFNGPDVRPARPEDAHALAEIDRIAYRDLVDEQTVNPLKMWQSRILNSHGWLLTAWMRGRAVALVSMLPVDIDPATFSTWNEATINGTFEGVYNPKSPNVYVAALTARPNRGDATTAVMAAAIGKSIGRGIRAIYFCARLPAFSKLAGTLTLDEYCATILRDENGSERALDPLLHYFTEAGMVPVRTVPNAWPIDVSSGGHGMLFRVDVPFRGWPLRYLWSWLFTWSARSEAVLATLLWRFQDKSLPRYTMSTYGGG